jgi:hypothetical protein
MSTTPTPEPTHLTEEQAARAEALRLARSVALSTSGFSATAPEPWALTYLAHYILSGEDAEPQPEPEPERGTTYLHIANSHAGRDAES